MSKDRVRVVSTTPTVGDFDSAVGTPIVVDEVASAAYILDSTGVVVELGTGGGGGRYRGGVDTTDDIVIDDSDSGLVLKSPDGHYWRVQVTNAGALTVTDLGTTKP